MTTHQNFSGLIVVSTEELTLIIEDALKRVLKSEGPASPPERKIINGLSGIANLLKVSKSTAYRMKKEGAFDGYISQIGKTITAYQDDIIKAGKAHFERTQKKSSVKKPRRIN